MRVLIAISPQMYRETVAFTLGSQRPGVKVEAVSPENLDRAAARLRPDVLVCHHEASPATREGVSHRIEIIYSDSLDALVVVDGREERVADIGLAGMLSVVDAAQEKTTSPG